MTKPRTGKEINCSHCGTQFYIPINRFNSAKYCSTQCKHKASISQQKAQCLQCGSDFYFIPSRGHKAKFCSNSCKGKAYQNKNGSVEVVCACCHSVFRCSPSKKRVYCSIKCRVIGKRVETFATASGVRKAMTRRGLINKCQNCGYGEVPQILGIHHINRDRSDNRLSNLKVLCPNCHSIEHMKCVVHSV